MSGMLLPNCPRLSAGSGYGPTGRGRESSFAICFREDIGSEAGPRISVNGLRKCCPRFLLPSVPRPFLTLAVVSQPWSYKVDGSLIQQLIVGAGQATAAEVSRRLLERFRSVTRYSRQAGLHTHDGQKPGRLEEMQSRKQELEEKIDRYRNFLAEWERLSQQEAETTERLRGAKENLELCQRQLQADRNFSRPTAASGRNPGSIPAARASLPGGFKIAEIAG